MAERDGRANGAEAAWSKGRHGTPCGSQLRARGRLHGPSDERAGALTRREMEIARFVALGHTKREYVSIVIATVERMAQIAETDAADSRANG
jgi:hypothetical protein